MRYFFRGLVVGVLFLSSALAGAEGELVDYHKVVLDNGAVVVCRYVAESQLVTVRVRVLSGLSNEGEYAGSGVSHFLEHLLFKSTRDRTAGEIRKEVKRMGGMLNGVTGLDSAEYYITVPNENFEEALVLLADMVTEPVFTDGEMEIERDVVLKEIRLRNDDPVSRRARLLFSEAYTEHVYRHPILGDEEAFKKLTREDILKYHSEAYTPERMVIGIAGGVPPDTALKAAEEKFREYRRGPPRRVDVFPEPEQDGERISEFAGDAILGYLAMGFHSTDLLSPDLYPGDVLSILLGRGNDSRLYKRLVRDNQLLYMVSCLNYTPKFPGLFVITGTGDPENLERARQEIFSVIGELKSGTIGDGEIERAKRLVISDYLHSHERIDSVASSMTSSQILTGDPAFFEKYVDEVKKVEKEDVRRIVSEYLTRDNSTTVFLLPRFYRKEEGVPATPGSGDVETSTHRSPSKPDNIKIEGEGGRSSPGPKKTRSIGVGKKCGETLRAPEERSVKLRNGLRIIVKRRERLPLVSVTLAVPGGLKSEDSANNGISNLTASLILKGTADRSEGEIIPAIERMGGNIRAFSGLNSLGLSMDLLAGDLDAGLDIFEDAARNAVFPEDEIARQKKRIIASIKEQDSDIFENGLVHLRRLLYGQHPYGMRVRGEAGNVERVSRERIAAFYREHFAPANAVLTVVGDVDVRRTVDDLAERFGKWEGRGAPLREREVVPLEEALEEDIVMQKEQSLLLMGFQGVRLKDKRKYALSVLSSILSGSDGRLFYAVREREGLAYTSGAVSVPGVDPGYFILYVATTEENLEKAKSAVLDVLRKVASGDITADEIESSKKWLITRHAHALETNHSVSMKMALDELYGLGFSDHKHSPARINAVTRDDIIRCAKEVLDPERGVVVVVRGRGSS